MPSDEAGSAGGAEGLTPTDRFQRSAQRVTRALGSLPALVGSVLLVAGWALAGPLFGFSDTWQLFINTTTTVATFWMVFVIQNTANREAKTTELKLDELIRAVGHARKDFLALDRDSEAALSRREREFERLAMPSAEGRARGRPRRGATSAAGHPARRAPAPRRPGPPAR